jgi:hypothetical protein
VSVWWEATVVVDVHYFTVLRESSMLVACTAWLMSNGKLFCLLY